jgi:regulator of RNase E activity RraA
MTALEPASEQEIVAGLRQVSTATLAAVARKRGLNTITLDGLRSTKPGTSMVGYARTVRYLPLREDLSAAYGGGMNAQKRAIEAIRPADVLAEAREQERHEQFIAARVAAGESIDGLFPLPEARRPDYQAWLAQQQPPLAQQQTSPATRSPKAPGSPCPDANGPAS